MDEELEPEVLTYDEFHRQLALMEWRERLRAYERGEDQVAGSRAGGSLEWLRYAVNRLAANVHDHV